MPSNRKTRDRQLAKLAARRAAERHRHRRNRLITIVVGLTVAAAGLSLLGFFLVHNPTPKLPAATPSASPTATATATPSPTQAVVACGAKKPAGAGKTKPTYAHAPSLTIDRNRTYRATVVTSCGTFVVQLDPKVAPNTVNSFVFLSRHHFFDGLTFHRISKNFVIQGGDPKGDGSGGPGYSTVDTPPSNATYPVGTVAMAKTGSEPAGTAGSQFFVVTSDTANSALANPTPSYAIIGKVVSGMDVVTKIADLPISAGGSSTDGPPASTVYIVSIRIQ